MPVRLPLHQSAFAVLAAMLFAGNPARGQQSIPVPNGSFEDPATIFVSTTFPSWQKTPQTQYYTPNPDISWDQQAGIFANTRVGSNTHVNNADGNQLGYIFADQGVGIFQLLTTTYQAGSTYQLKVGVVGQGGGMLDDVTLDIQLYYVNQSGAQVVIADGTAVENSQNFPDHVTEFDTTASLQMVLATDAWANQPIGIQIIGLPTMLDDNGMPLSGGYWDIDNVRLTGLVVPEPATCGLLAFGLGACFLRRNRATGLR